MQEFAFLWEMAHFLDWQRLFDTSRSKHLGKAATNISEVHLRISRSDLKDASLLQVGVILGLDSAGFSLLPVHLSCARFNE